MFGGLKNLPTDWDEAQPVRSASQKSEDRMMQASRDKDQVSSAVYNERNEKEQVKTLEK